MVDDVEAQQEYDAFFEEVFTELEDKVRWNKVAQVEFSITIWYIGR